MIISPTWFKIFLKLLGEIKDKIEDILLPIMVKMFVKNH